MMESIYIILCFNLLSPAKKGVGWVGVISFSFVKILPLMAYSAFDQFAISGSFELYVQCPF